MTPLIFNDPQIGQSYYNDPRLAYSQQLLQQGSSVAPVQSWGEGLARALSAGVGGLLQSNINKGYQTREGGYEKSLAAALANPDQMQSILSQNPDTAPEAFNFIKQQQLYKAKALQDLYAKGLTVGQDGQVAPVPGYGMAQGQVAADTTQAQIPSEVAKQQAMIPGAVSQAVQTAQGTMPIDVAKATAIARATLPIEMQKAIGIANATAQIDVEKARQMLPINVQQAIGIAQGTAPVKTQQAVDQATALGPVNAANAASTAQAVSPITTQTAANTAVATGPIAAQTAANTEIAKLDARAQAANIQKGTPEYREFMATNGQFSNSDSVGPMAKMIADYKSPPLSSFAMRSPWGQQVMSQVQQLNPKYNATVYGQRSQAMKDFGTGQQGNTVRFLNVAISHLNVLDKLGTALANGDVRTINAIEQRYHQEFGTPAPQNFDAAKQIVADEVIKAVVGTGGAQADRETAQQAVNKASSWEQLQGVTQTYRRLLAGQMVGLQKQYKLSTGNDDFDSMLLPETRQELNGINPADSGTGPPITATGPGGARLQLNPATNQWEPYKP